LSQRFRDFELIVLDDGSTDDTFELARRVCSTASDIQYRVLRNVTRQGLFGNWNRCVAECRGTYVLLFHQDDLIEPGMLERAVSAFERDRDLGMVHCGYRCIDGSGADLPPWSVSPFVGRAGGEEFLRRIIAENFVCCPSVIVPRDVYKRLGLYDTRFSFTGDLEMWIRIASSYDVFFDPEIGVRYRLHAAQATEDFRKERAARAELEHIVAAFVGLQGARARYPDLWRTVVRDTLWTIGQHARAAPADVAWALRMISTRPLDVALACRDVLVKKVGHKMEILRRRSTH
jgi:glycosyltransferase involved in cell wall biosynthesis